MNNNFKKINDYIVSKCYDLPIFKSEIKKNGVIYLKKTKLDLFSFLTKTIISQQISDKVAEITWEKYCLNIKEQNPRINDIPDQVFLKKVLDVVGLSKQKKNYIIGIYQSIILNKININLLQKMNDEDFHRSLIKFRGIGPWTCNMTLIFFCNRLNIFLNDDLVIKKVMSRLVRIEKKEFEIKERFSPFLSILTLHLWKMSQRILQ